MMPGDYAQGGPYQYNQSPHLRHLDHPSGTSTPSPPHQYAQPPLPAMAPQGRPTSYPSPAYGSPSMTAYQYPPNQHPNAQRDSPSFTALPPPNGYGTGLPPMRLNPADRGGLPQPHPGHLPPPAAMQPQPMYYGQGMPSGPNPMLAAPSQGMRYALPAAAGSERIMSGGRHKKEIKRRTKTGCLTCRKRRIKCDEAHPTCKNCAKSKRECMGYDPIFKAQPGPAAIQPAPVGGSAPVQASMPIASSLPPPMAYQVGPGSGPAYSQAHSQGMSSPGSSVEQYGGDYGGVIDPALQAVSGVVHPDLSGPQLLAEAAQYQTRLDGGRNDLKRPRDGDSPNSSTYETPRTNSTPTPGHATLSGSQRESSAKRIKINDLLGPGGGQQVITPPPSDVTNFNPPDSLQGARVLYETRFAPKLDAFFETDWFSTRGLDKVRQDSHLVECMGNALEKLKARGLQFRPDSEEDGHHIGGPDAKVISTAIKMMYGFSLVSESKQNGAEQNGSSSPEEADHTTSDVLVQIALTEALLSNKSIDAAPVFSPESNSSEDARRQRIFWKTLGDFLMLKDMNGTNAAKVTDTLHTLQRFEDGKASRHLIYSIAVARKHLAAKEHGTNGETATSPAVKRAAADEYRDAQHHIEWLAKEDTSSCVVQRVSSRAASLWGVNIKGNSEI